ncbi:MAG: sporulation protein YqfD, partial [Clostridiales bacterium]|nr:sporulation protein YqfD [Clostridiales bacterium]
MFLKIYFFITGSLNIRIRGYMAFRFLNILANEGVYIWNVSSDDEGVCFWVGKRDIKRVEKPARKSGCCPEILCEKGLPVFWGKLKKRYFFTAGALFFSLFLLFSTGRIWLIEVRGNYRAPTGEILELCAENSLTYGAKKSLLDTNLIERELKNRFKDISFASVSVSGTRALITVSETIPTAEKTEEAAAGDIVSECSAVITDLTVSAGTPMVREGTAVGAGDILISGEVFLKAEQEVLGSVFTAAEGEVYGKTAEEYSFMLPLK